jgi:hypothetical protein
LLVVLALLVLAAAASVAPIDDRSTAGEPFRRAAVSAVEAMRPSVAQGPLLAGFGKASLTPILEGTAEDWRSGIFPGLPLAGYSRRLGRSATGIHDDLWVKSIALEAGGERVVFVSLDMLLVPEAVTEDLAATLLPALSLDRSRLYVSATHTHSGPGGFQPGIAGFIVAGRYRPDVSRWIAQQVEASIRQALDDLQPASVAAGDLDWPDLVRVRGKGRGDSRFKFMVLRQDAGQTAILASFGAHATVIPAENRELSGDYPAAWQRAMELGDFDLAVFMAGPVGGQRARQSGDGIEAAEAYGRELAERLRPALATAKYERETTVGALGLDLPLPGPQVRLGDRWRLREWLARLLLPVPESAFVQSVRIGALVLASTPGDYSGELAAELAEDLSGAGMISAVTSFNGAYIGYIMPRREFHDEAYEARTMSFYGPDLGEYMNEMLALMCRRLAEAKPQQEAAAASAEARPAP